MEQFPNTPDNNSDSDNELEDKSLLKDTGTYVYYKNQINLLKAEKIELETYLEPIKNMEKEEMLFSQNVKDAINNLSTAIEEQIEFVTNDLQRQQDLQDALAKDKFSSESRE